MLKCVLSPNKMSNTDRQTQHPARYQRQLLLLRNPLLRQSDVVGNSGSVDEVSGLDGEVEAAVDDVSFLVLEGRSALVLEQGYELGMARE